jgi:SAM-dependent methyltransferase
MTSDLELTDPAILRSLEAELREVYFCTHDSEFLETDEGKAEIQTHVSGRYNQCVKHMVPWVRRHLDLEDADILEVGCGTGSSTAAFARFSRHVHAYEIEKEGLEGARRRMRILGISNVGLHQVEPETIVEELRANHPDGVDCFLLYAVLEHLTIPERLEMIETAWGLLKPGGLFVVAETPNRFTYWDRHTTFLPLFHLLPDELAFRCLEKTSRWAFKESMRQALEGSREEAATTRARWGLGVSYHEFELALGDRLENLVVADGYEKEIVKFFPIDGEERLLQTFLLESGMDVPIGFARFVLNLIFRKPGVRPGQDAEPPPPALDRSGLVTNYARDCAPMNELSAQIELTDRQARMLDERWAALKKMEKMISERDKAIRDNAKIIVQSEKAIAANAALLDERLASMREMEGLIAERDKAIAANAKLLDERLASMREMDQMIVERDNTIQSQSKLLEERDAMIRELSEHLEELDARTRRMESQLAEIGATIEKHAPDWERIHRLRRRLGRVIHPLRKRPKDTAE